MNFKHASDQYMASGIYRFWFPSSSFVSKFVQRWLRAIF